VASYTSNLVKILVFLVFSGVLASCSAPSEIGEPEKIQLIQRVTDRWRCLETNDYACAYEFLSPAYREVFTEQMYRNRYFSDLNRRLTGVNVVAYDSGAAVASVVVGVMSRPSVETTSASRAVVVVPANLTEAWLWEKGEWWYHESS